MSGAVDEDFKWLSERWDFKLKRMKRFGLVFAVAVLACGLAVAAETEQRTLQTDTEKFALSVPKEWPAFETNKTERSTVYYRIGPADTNYSIQLHFNNPL